MSDDTFSWNGGAGSFADPNMWADLTDPANTGTLAPGSGDTAIFSTGGEVSDGSDVAALQIDANVSFAGEITADSLTIDAMDMLTASDGFDVQGVTLDGTLLSGATGYFFGPGTIDADGSLALNGSGSTPPDFGVVGSLGVAGQISGAFRLLISGDVEIAGPQATLSTQATGTGFSLAGDIIVGVAGHPQATIDVSNGGSIISDNVYVGVQDEAGLAIVDAAHWTNSGFVEVGDDQLGTLVVENAATFDAGALEINVAGPGGTATLEDAGSMVLASQGLLVGLGGTLLVTTNAFLNTAGAFDDIGSFVSNPGTTTDPLVQVTNGGTWHSGSIELGPGTLELQGGTLVSAALTIGASASVAGVASATGTGASWTNTGSIIVGSRGDGTLSLAASASLGVGGDLVAGASAAATGTITVDGAATTLQVSGDLIIGQGGTGVLALSNGAALSVTGTLQVGGTVGTGTVTDTGGDPPRHFGGLAINNGVANVAPGADNAWLVDLGTTQNIDVGGIAGAAGTLNLPQTGTVVAGSGTVTIGGAGTGNLTLADNALFDAAVNDVTVGGESTANGTVTVNGDGALLQAGNLTVGDQGAALLTVSGGGELQVANTLAIADNTAATIVASAVITDAGSDATVAALGVGGNGSGTLLVAGATLSVSGDGEVGENASGKGTMTVNAGSVDVSGTLTVGAAGNGLADVNQDGTLAADSLAIGIQSGGKGELDVNSTGALTGADIAVGSAGKGTLKLTGATVNTTGDVNIAEQVNGSAQIVIEDQQSQWTVGGNFTVAAAGIAGATIKGGSLLAVNGDVVVGDQAGAGGTLTVSASLVVAGSTIASEINFAGRLVVGNAGDGALTVQQGAEVVATGGGIGEIDIGVMAGETSTVTITGAGSLLQGKSLAVGGAVGAAGGHGTLNITKGGLVRVADADVWPTGLIELNGGTLEVQGSVAAGGTIKFAGAGAFLHFGSPDDAGGSVTNFDFGETIDLTGIAPASVTLSGGRLMFTGGSFPLTLASGDTIRAKASGDGAEVTVACFVAGTRVLTEAGEIEVERLEPGARVFSVLHRKLLPIVWIGHRRLREAWPVCVAAHAFGPGQPHRVLLLSPDHAVFVDGVLVPVRHLINGATIAQERRDEVCYFHVELAEHGVLLAEGLPAESYLDTGNRAAFANGGGAVRMHPDFALRVWQRQACAKLVVDGPAVVAIREHLHARTKQLGWTATDAPAPLLLADRQRIAPRAGGDGTVTFALPPGCVHVRLLSRAAIAAHSDPRSIDHRRLGLAVTALWLDGTVLPLDDARLGAGWHAPEPGLRWTDGAARIALAGERTLTVRYHKLLSFWAERAKLQA